MIRVIAISRSELRDFSSDEPYVVISITEPDARPAELQRDANRKAILRLQFHDVDRIMEGTQAITSAQGSQIWAFAKENATSVGLIVCQCEAGISRSAGIAAALAKAFNDDDREFFESNRYLPNRMAYRAVMKASQQ
jgi:predicted protein tyrosine phosphatase